MTDSPGPEDADPAPSTGAAGPDAAGHLALGAVFHPVGFVYSLDQMAARTGQVMASAPRSSGNSSTSGFSFTGSVGGGFGGGGGGGF